MVKELGTFLLIFAEFDAWKFLRNSVNGVRTAVLLEADWLKLMTSWNVDQSNCRLKSAQLFQQSFFKGCRLARCVKREGIGTKARLIVDNARYFIISDMWCAIPKKDWFTWSFEAHSIRRYVILTFIVWNWKIQALSGNFCRFFAKSKTIFYFLGFLANFGREWTDFPDFWKSNADFRAQKIPTQISSPNPDLSSCTGTSASASPCLKWLKCQVL